MREITQGMKYPYHGKQPTDWAERASLGILYDLNDRRGIKHALAAVDEGVRDDIVKMMASIIRAALPAELDATDMWWRDASRERPARDQLVIAWTDKYGALLADRETSNPDFGWSCDGKVLYWMPLPPIPSQLPHGSEPSHPAAEMPPKEK